MTPNRIRDPPYKPGVGYLFANLKPNGEWYESRDRGTVKSLSMAKSYGQWYPPGTKVRVYEIDSRAGTKRVVWETEVLPLPSGISPKSCLSLDGERVYSNPEFVRVEPPKGEP
ncbi:MAG TPA: hypothetical protein VGG32_11150 [Thermoplasmata archaeon]|jgi:hypothetical protein